MRIVKSKLSFVIALLMLAFNFLSAQDSVQNGNFERWKLKEFKCCGRNIDQPWYWGITEQLTGLNYNKFTFRVLDSSNVHSGLCSIELYSDTSTLNNLGLIPGVIAYGGMADSASTAIAIGPNVQAAGYPVSSNPEWLSFYMKAKHNETDTAYYIYLFTRWNMVTQKEDTLSFKQVDIPDNTVHMNQWVNYIDTIHYTMSGTADTVRILFFGGRFGNARLKGNATFIDDISFYYPATGLVALNGEPVIELYPNPSSTFLTIKTGQYQPGNQFTLYDLTGRPVKSCPIENFYTTLNLSSLAAGEYYYQLRAGNNVALTRGTLIIAR